MAGKLHPMHPVHQRIDRNKPSSSDQTIHQTVHVAFTTTGYDTRTTTTSSPVQIKTVHTL
eukprot:scaffold179202_cov56-Attheya_sp.AAC.1